MCVVKQQTQEKPKKSHEQDILQKHSQIDWSINICILRNACHELLCVFGDCYASGTQDAEVKKNYCYGWRFLGLLVKQETRPFR